MNHVALTAVPLNAPNPVRLDGSGKTTLEIGRNRLVVAAFLFVLAFGGLTARLLQIGLLETDPAVAAMPAPAAGGAGVHRADIVDRNGVLLATNLSTHSLYADTRLIRDPAGTAARIAGILPTVDAATARRDFSSGRSFVWLKRGLTPRQVHAVNTLGEPGLMFLPEQRRAYPLGSLAAHVVGDTDIDNRGIAGVERQFDEALRGSPSEALALSLDMRFQHVVRDELSNAVDEFRAIGGAGLVLDAGSGEVLAMVSLPDFDPSGAERPGADVRFNRATLGVYELGSTFKSFTMAMALDAGTVTLKDGYDASEPLRLARFTIRDFHAEDRWLSVPEIFLHSSNIGAAKMALDVGAERQRAFFERLGLLERLSTELPELGLPLAPADWREVNVATMGFGHGIAVSPLHLAAGIAALVNGGVLHPPTVIKRDDGDRTAGRRVISAETSRTMRRLFRLVVERGTGRKADAAGYPVGGKTGTAEKSSGRGYDGNRLLSSFVGAFPINKPRFVVFAVLDEPKGLPRTFGYATGGWTAAPVVGRIAARIGPIAGLDPVTLPEADSETDSVLDGIEIRLASF